MIWKLIVVSSVLFVEAQFYEDKRCRCVCPTPASILNNTKQTDRTLYIAYVPPNKCNCDGVILPKVADEIRENAQVFCPRCDCKYETRNTTVIMVVVILVVWVIMLLVGYYLFLMLLEMLVTKKPAYSYQIQSASEETENLLMQGEEIED
ncbi:proton-transporting V-type ATPase complex assembly regulator TMEM9-like [Melitaea cinxia]|uniref:proton-transporting V-type ATPase complex assembly regulator TMEM9-like n=1 Tax=Melitaea cinxia TaxID=113334 RepID=UPI001E2723ED|nr:proton-transporting V-type ATPase complex assembly regulator TMEM9-like [Melitaea cinxia]